MLFAHLLNQQVTVSFNVEQVITWLIIGLIAGALAGMLIRGRRYGLLGSIAVGLIGAVVGGFLFTILRIPTPAFLEGAITIKLIDIVIAFIGAALVLLVFSLVYRRRGPAL